MGLVLNFRVATPETSDSLKQFFFFDTTGIYPNPITGWGAPNPDVTLNTVAQLSINAYLNATIYNVNVLDPLFIPFPNTNNLPFPIINTDIGLASDASIPSGIYLLNYQVTADDTNDYSTSKYVYLDAVHLCCADKLLVKAKRSCDSNMEKMAIIIQAKIASVHALISPNCDAVDAANDVVQQITALCDSSGCGCGN